LEIANKGKYYDSSDLYNYVSAMKYYNEKDYKNGKRAISKSSEIIQVMGQIRFMPLKKRYLRDYRKKLQLRRKPRKLRKEKGLRHKKLQ